MYKIGIVLIVTTVFACGRINESIMDHDHEEDSAEHAPIMSTLFSANIEYYIEYEFLEVGKESGFLVHVTELESYDPYTSGTLTIEVNGKKVTVEGPEHPGIFHLPFVPTDPGHHSIVYTFQNESFKDQVSAHADIKEADQHMGHDDAHKDDHDDEGHDRDERHDHGDAGHDHDDNLNDKGELKQASHSHSTDGVEPGEIVYLKEQAWKTDFMVPATGR